MAETTALLTGRDLDAAVAQKIMGWVIVPDGDKWRVSAKGQWSNSFISNSPRLADLDADIDDRLYGRYAMPAYSQLMEFAMQVELRMRQFGFAEQYVWQLIKLTGGGARFPSRVEQLCPLVFATAEQRCRAAIATVEESLFEVLPAPDEVQP